MKKKITLFLINGENNSGKMLAEEFAKNEEIYRVVFIGATEEYNGYNFIRSKYLFDSNTINQVAKKTKTDYALN